MIIFCFFSKWLKYFDYFKRKSKIKLIVNFYWNHNAHIGLEAIYKMTYWVLDDTIKLKIRINLNTGNISLMLSLLYLCLGCVFSSTKYWKLLKWFGCPYAFEYQFWRLGKIIFHVKFDFYQAQCSMNCVYEQYIMKN